MALRPVLRDQGLFSRLLVAAPKSLAGTRFHRPPGADSQQMLAAYNNHLARLLQHALPVDAERPGELRPRQVVLDAEAQGVLIGFGDAIEGQMGEGGYFHPVKGLAAKASDHAVRLASVMGLFENFNLVTIDKPLIARGIKLAQWYLDEALRLTEAEAYPVDLLNAEKVLAWVQASGATIFSLPCIYMRGPNAVRTKDAARKAISILVEHRCVERADGRHKLDGQMRTECYLVRNVEA